MGDWVSSVVVVDHVDVLSASGVDDLVGVDPEVEGLVHEGTKVVLNECGVMFFSGTACLEAATIILKM